MAHFNNSILLLLSLLSVVALVLGSGGTTSSVTNKYGAKSYKSSSRTKDTPPPSSSSSSTSKVVSSSRAMKSSSDIDTYDVGLDPFATSAVDKTGPMDSSASSWDHDNNHHHHKSSVSSKHSQQGLPQVAPRYSSPSKSYGASSSEALYASYPYATYSNYHYNPLLDSYYERERAARELAAVSRYPVSLPGAHSTMAAAASSLFNSIAPHPIDVDDALALASHSQGWGWSSKEHNTYDHVNHYESKVNTNAIGLLGLLGLLTLLSQVLLLLTTTTTTAAARIKRSISIYSDEETQEAKMKRIFSEVLPLLTPVAHARDGQIPLDCTLQGVCLTNRLLVKEYGFSGRPAANRVTTAISSLLQEVGQGEPSALKKRIEKAGLEGRNQKDCQTKYPMCKALEVKGGPTAYNFVIGMNDVPKLLQKVKEVSYTAPSSLI